MGIRMIAAALVGAAALAATAHATDTLGNPLREEGYPSQFFYAPPGTAYTPSPPPPAYNYDPYMGRTYRY